MLTAVGAQVRKRDQALAYYTGKLGFEVRQDVPMGADQRWLEVAPAGAQTRILLYKATPDQPGADSYEAAQARIGPSTGMALEVDDIVATFAALREHGITVVDEPTEQPYGR
jgi:catechol 2,3-dioxygenase-like lactoylglutathione lyase family enzyme